MGQFGEHKLVLEINFSLVATIGGHTTAWLPPIIRFMTKQNSIWSKALIMPLTIWNCVLSYQWNNYCSENQLVLPRKYSSPNFQVAFFATHIYNR